jgi:5-formyltetrahydrofolate cyclo-ligase
MTTKAQLREEIAQRRRGLDPEWSAAASARIADQLRDLDVFRDAGTVALYKATPGEVDLELLFAACRDAGKRICIPFFLEKENIYALTEITAETRFKPGRFGIEEPLCPALAAVSGIDLMIVPGVAFDPSGNRLGRGGGYYDRLLSGFSGISAAAAFDFQIYPQIPYDHHDIRVDLIATETKVMKV